MSHHFPTPPLPKPDDPHRIFHLFRWSLAFLVPLIILLIELGHLFSSHSWLPGSFKPVGFESDHPVAGVIVTWWTLSVVGFVLVVWLYGLISWINHSFDGVNRRLEHKSTKQSVRLANIFSVLHAHSASSKALEMQLVGIAEQFWQRVTPHLPPEAEWYERATTGRILEDRVFTLLQEARRIMDEQSFALRPWSFNEFAQYPDPLYAKVNVSVRATNIGPITNYRFFGQDGVFLERFLKINEAAMVRNRKRKVPFFIQRLFIFDRETLDSAEGAKLYEAMHAMARIQVEVRYLSLSRARALLGLEADAEPLDFTIFETATSNGNLIEVGTLKTESYVNDPKTKIPVMEITENRDRYQPLCDVFKDLFDKGQPFKLEWKNQAEVLADFNRLFPK